MKITDFDIKISAENVCAFLDGDKTGDLYEEIMDELEEMLPQAYEKIRPVALLEFGSLEGYSIEADGKKVKEALFGVCSIGKEMGEWSTSLFAQGDYLGGMLADAIADDYLFQMDDASKQMIASFENCLTYIDELSDSVDENLQERLIQVTNGLIYPMEVLLSSFYQDTFLPPDKLL